MPKLVERIPTKDEALQRFQESVLDAVNPALRHFLREAVLTDAVELGTAAKQVEHRLGRKPLGWLPVSPDADARIWESGTSADATRLLKLSASATVNVRLLVF